MRKLILNSIIGLYFLYVIGLSEREIARLKMKVIEILSELENSYSAGWNDGYKAAVKKLESYLEDCDDNDTEGTDKTRFS